MIRTRATAALRIVFGLCFAIATHAFAQEVAVPDTPVPSTITAYKVVRFELEREPDWRFVIVFKDSNGKEYRDEHVGLNTVQGPTGPVNNPEGADELMKALNTANLTTNSLIKRLLTHLVQHGKIPASTIQGTPEGSQ